MLDTAPLRRTLARRASELAARLPPGWTAEHLVELVGVGLRHDSERPGPQLVNSSNGPVVLIPKSMATVVPGYKRFLVAHEIGHWFLLRDCDASPHGRSEYWIHEKLCDRFARDLLMPKEAILPELERAPRLAAESLSFCAELARRFGVTWRTSADRISELDRNTIFLAIATEKDGRARVLYSTAPKRAAQRALINSEEALARLANDYRQRLATPLSAIDVSCLALQQEVKSAAASWSSKELRVALAVKAT